VSGDSHRIADEYELGAVTERHEKWKINTRQTHDKVMKIIWGVNDLKFTYVWKFPKNILIF